MTSRVEEGGGSGRSVVVVAYQGLCTFEFGIAVEVFGLPRPEIPDWYSFRVCAAEPGPLSAVGGIKLVADAGLDELQSGSTIIIPGWRGPDAEPPKALLSALQRAYANGSRLVSICSGVFVLAATGLLSGRRATTHWRYADQLRSKFPDIVVDPDVLYIDGGRILTSAGSAAGLDLCLHIVRKDYGPRVANQVARRLVIPPHREGNQAQFVEAPMPVSGSAMSALFDWVRRNLGEDLSIERLARRANVSERTLIRRFHEIVGCSPKQWILGERINRARALLEGTELSIDQIAADSGFGSVDNLRHYFKTHLQVSPSLYRDRFTTIRKTADRAGGSGGR